MSWCVIINPAAGRAGDLIARVEAELRRRRVDYVINVSERPGQVAEIVHRAGTAGIRRFAGVGGDGTAHLVLNALMGMPWERPPGLAVLPAGSGSDFIRTFALPRTLEDAAAHLTTPDWYPTDVLEVTGRFGKCFALNVVEAGVGAAAVTTAAKMPRWVGERRYPLGFWLTLPRFRPDEVTVRVDERRNLTGSALAVILANGQYFGGGMNVAPRASVADGQMDVQVFSGPRRKALTVMPRVVRGMHLRHKNVKRTTGAAVTVDVPADWPIEADGELIGTGPISVSVLPAAIEFKI
jgi:YegS/Rv2252/BmrU family lipid kinase